MAGLIFLAGIFGVGKSTLAVNLSRKLNIPEFSASDLISKSNNELYGANKFVKDASDNQNILVHEVQNLLTQNTSILLAGHFCIFNKDYSVNILPSTFFEQVTIKQIILLKANVSRIMQNLLRRDGNNYNMNNLEQLQNAEILQAAKISNENHIPLVIYDMLFTNEDVTNIINLIS